MKKNYIVLILLFLTNQFFAQNLTLLSNYDNLGVPNNVTYVTVPASLISTINASFPEGYPVPTYNPQYIANGIDTDIELLAAADVSVTFVQEGAGYKNVLGYYTYTGTPSASSPSDVTIIFPNVSASGSGGGLNTGATMYIGTFPAGTKIGWFLIADGFQNNKKIGNGNWKLYSNPDYNPEPLASQRKHNVMLKDSISEVVVLGFEDIRRDYSSCDNDFNDALFFVKSNPITAMKLSNLNSTTAPGSSGSGADGGLESGLASRVAERLFKRQLNNEKRLDSFEKQPMFELSSDRGEELSKFIPQDVFANSTLKISTPNDLTEMTNASQVLSVDYYQNTDNQRLAAILATETFGKVYEHTKIVCDRLVGAQLTEIRKILIQDKVFTINKLIQPNKNIEYCLSFSAYYEGGAWFVESQWGVNQFPDKSRYLNFQIWGNTPAYVQRLGIEVIEKLQKQFTNVRMSQGEIKVPGVYAKSGKYKNGILYLELMNLNKSNQVTISGEAQNTETDSQKKDWTYKFNLNGQKTQTVEIPIGKVFDSGIVIENDKNEGEDFMYLADGVWSYGINDNEAEISNFEVLPSEDGKINEKELRVERNVKVAGKVKHYASIFRTLRPSGKTVDLRDYDELVFDAKGTGDFEIVIVKKSIETWEHQFRTTARFTSNEREIRIPFSQFRSIANTKFDANDILSVAIAAKGNKSNYNSFDFELSNMRFKKANTQKIGTIKAYPNPANEKLNLEFKLPQEGSYQLDIYDTNGRILKSIIQQGYEGLNQMTVNIIDLENGIYYSRITQNNQNEGFKFLVLKH